MFSAALSHAQTNWITVGTGDFNSAVNWSGGVPTSLLNTQIINGTSATPTIVNLSGTGNVANLRIDAFNTLNANLGSQLQIYGTQVANGGAINVIAGSGNNTYMALRQSFSLSGGGKLTLNSGDNNGQSYLRAGVNGMTLTNVDNTIQGYGVIGTGGSLALVNQGTVNANSNGNSLTIDGAVTVTNSGTLEATNGGILNLSTGGTLTNTAGTIMADAGSAVNIGNSTSINGGTLTTVGTGVLGTATNNTASVNNVTLSADSTYTGRAGSTTNFSGTLTNSGNFQLNAGGGSNSAFALTGNTTLSGGGTVTLNSGDTNGWAYLKAASNGMTLTNVNNTIQGYGYIGTGGSLTLVNQGTVTANSSGNTLTLTGPVAVTNSGSLGSTGGGILNIITGGTIDNTGGMVSAASGSSTYIGSNTTLNGGTLTSAGTGFLGTGANSNATLNNVTLSSGSTYTGSTNTTTNISGSIANSGNFQMNAGTGTGSVLGLTTNTTFTGGGTITLNSGDNNGQAYLRATANGISLTNVDNTIQGYGVIGTVGNLAFLNQATINANSNGNTLTLAGPITVTNTGTLEATGGGILSIANGGTLTNTGGTITSGTGSAVYLGNSTTINGGTLSTVGTGFLGNAENGTAALNNVTLTSGSTYTGRTNTTTNVSGSITNSGNFQMNAGAGTNTNLALTANTTFTGAGTITLNSGDNNGQSYLRAAANGLTLTNADNTVQGYGVIGTGNNMAFANQSTVNANSNGQTLALDGSVAVTNTGVLEATNGGTLLIRSIVNNQNGSIAASGGTVNIAGGTVKGGTLSGAGLGTVSNATLDGATASGAVTFAPGSFWTAGTGTQTYVNGSIVNQGTFHLTAGAGTNNILGLNGNTTFTGGGTITLSSSDTNGAAMIQQQVGGLTFTNADNTIQGQGTIGNGGLRFVNQSMVNANSNGNMLLMNGSGGVTNTGTLKAANNGTLMINTTVDNQNGSIISEGGAAVNISAGIVKGGTLSGSGLKTTTYATLDGSTGSGAITFAPGSVWTAGINAQTYVNGSIVNNGTMQFTSGSGYNTQLGLVGSTTFTGGGTITLNSGDNNGSAIIQQQVGGLTLTNADNTIHGYGVVGNGGLTVVNGSAGTVLADAAGQTLTVNGSGGLTNNGTLQVNAGSTLLVASSLTNYSGGTLTGGTYIVNGTAGNTGTMQMSGLGNNPAGEVVNNAATIVLNGPTANTRFIDAGGNDVLKPLAANLASGNLTVSGGYAMNTAGAFSNAGNVHVSGSGTQLKVPLADYYTQTAGTTLVDSGATLNMGHGGSIQAGSVQLANGTVQASLMTISEPATVLGNGSVNVRPTNSGTIRAQGGTLSLTDGIQAGGAASRAESVAGGTLNVSAGSSGSSAAFLVNNGSLNVGTNTFTVDADYTNANFGTGNGFNARANVTGSGAINASGTTAQAITGTNVTGGTTSNATLVLGNLREGQSITQSFNVANTGSSGPVLRGAIQTNVNGGNLTDSRLSGSGVTAANFSPLAAGGSQAFSVTFNGASAGSLNGQTIAVVNNFTNVADQTLAITGAIYRSAQAGTITPNPVNVGNVHVGGTLATTLGVTNVAPASGGYTETLGASVTGTTGGITTGGSVSGLAAGATSNAISASFDTSTAGARSGTVSVGFTSTEVGGSGLGTVGVGSQNVTLNGGVYRLAEATLGNVSFGNVLVGSSQTRYVSVSNTALNDLFSEGLDASLGTFSGASAGLLSGTGSITNLAAGATNNTTLAITLNTSAAGAVTADVQVLLASNGATSSGLGITALPSQLVPISGTIGGVVGNLASAGPATPNPVNLGNARVGDLSPTHAVSLTNVAVGPAEGLNAAIATVSTGLTASGSFNGLAAGATDNSSLVVGMNTATAGNKSGTATITLASDGTFNNGQQTALSPQTVSVTGGVYRMAEGSVAPNPVVINAREGTSAAQALTVTNGAVADGYSEGLRASSAGSTGAASVSGSTGLIAAGSSGGGLVVSLDTSIAGAKSGTATVSFLTDGTGTSGLSSIAAGDQTISVTGGVYRAAEANTLAAVVDLGTIRTGTIVDTALSVSNIAGDTGGYTETLGASVGSASAGLLGTGSISGLETGMTSNALGLRYTAGAAGAYAGGATVNFLSEEINGSGLGSLALDSQSVTVNANVNALAALGLQNSSGFTFTGTGTYSGILDFGMLTNPSLLSASFGLSNSAMGPADSLLGYFNLSGLSGTPFSVIGADNFDLAAGAQLPLELRFDPASVGAYSATFTFDLASHNPYQTDLNLGTYSFTLRGEVGGGSAVPDSGPGVVALLALLSTLALGRRFGRSALTPRN